MQNMDKQRSEIEGVMKNLKEQIAPQAQRSERSLTKDPAFASPTSRVTGSHDGMLGSLLLEGMLGMAFGEAISDAVAETAPAAHGLNYTNTVQAYSEFASDRQSSNRTTASNENYEIGDRGVLSGSFKNAGTPFPREKARKDFFPGESAARQKIEDRLARCGMMLQKIDSVPYAPAMH